MDQLDSPSSPIDPTELNGKPEPTELDQLNACLLSVRARAGRAVKNVCKYYAWKWLISIHLIENHDLVAINYLNYPAVFAGWRLRNEGDGMG